MKKKWEQGQDISNKLVGQFQRFSIFREEKDSLPDLRYLFGSLHGMNHLLSKCVEMAPLLLADTVAAPYMGKWLERLAKFTSYGDSVMYCSTLRQCVSWLAANSTKTLAQHPVREFRIFENLYVYLANACQFLWSKSAITEKRRLIGIMAFEQALGLAQVAAVLLRQEHKLRHTYTANLFYLDALVGMTKTPIILQNEESGEASWNQDKKHASQQLRSEGPQLGSRSDRVLQLDCWRRQIHCW